MKTEAQWQKLWDELKIDGRRNEFQIVRKLFHIYTGYENKMDAMWDIYPLALQNRFLTGRWNTHHVHIIRAIASKYLNNSRDYIFPISTDDIYEHLFSSEKTTPYRKEEQGIGKGTHHNSEEHRKYIPTVEELKTFAEITSSNQALSVKEYAGQIIRDNKTYKVKMYEEGESKSFYLESIVRDYQPYDLLLDLSVALADTPIDRNGDLASILKLIEKNTAFSIDVKYADFGPDHIRAIGKDFIDTFKPWKSQYYFRRDLAQPFHGINNTLRGALSFLVIPLVFARHLIDVFKEPKDELWDNVYLMVREPARHFIDGFGLAVRGLSQMITTPLTYMIKIPLRACISYSQNKKNLIEEDQNIQDLVRENTNESRAVIHRKFHKGIARGRETLVNEHYELAFFKAVQFPQDPVHKKIVENMNQDAESVENYTDIFSKKM